MQSEDRGRDRVEIDQLHRGPDRADIIDARTGREIAIAGGLGQEARGGNLPQREKGKSRDKVAAFAGASGPTARRHKWRNYPVRKTPLKTDYPHLEFIAFLGTLPTVPQSVDF